MNELTINCGMLLECIGTKYVKQKRNRIVASQIDSFFEIFFKVQKYIRNKNSYKVIST